MSLEKEIVIDKIEIVENGTVQVRQATRIVEDGKVLSQSFHRWAIMPGQDYSDQPEQVRVICESTHTPEVIENFKSQSEYKLG